MKAFVLAVIGAFVIAAVSWWALSQVQQSSSTAFTTESVRIGEASERLLEHTSISPQRSEAANARE